VGSSGPGGLVRGSGFGRPPPLPRPSTNNPIATANAPSAIKTQPHHGTPLLELAADDVGGAVTVVVVWLLVVTGGAAAVLVTVVVVDRVVVVVAVEVVVVVVVLVLVGVVVVSATSVPMLVSPVCAFEAMLEAVCSACLVSVLTLADPHALTIQATAAPVSSATAKRPASVRAARGTAALSWVRNTGLGASLPTRASLAPGEGHTQVGEHHISTGGGHPRLAALGGSPSQRPARIRSGHRCTPLTAARTTAESPSKW
jgi:hypothetical protein